MSMWFSRKTDTVSGRNRNNQQPAWVILTWLLGVSLLLTIWAGTSPAFAQRSRSGGGVVTPTRRIWSGWPARRPSVARASAARRRAGRRVPIRRGTVRARAAVRRPIPHRTAPQRKFQRRPAPHRVARPHVKPTPKPRTRPTPRSVVSDTTRVPRVGDAAIQRKLQEEVRQIETERQKAIRLAQEAYRHSLAEADAAAKRKRLVAIGAAKNSKPADTPKPTPATTTKPVTTQQAKTKPIVSSTGKSGKSGSVTGRTSKASVTRALTTAYAEANAAFSRKDVDGALKVRTADYVLVDKDGHTRDLAATRQEMTQFFQVMQSSRGRSRVEALTLNSDGTEAVATTHETGRIVFKRNGKLVTLDTDAVSKDTWVRQNGKWRLKKSEGVSIKTTER